MIDYLGQIGCRGWPLGGINVGPVSPAPLCGASRRERETSKQLIAETRVPIPMKPGARPAAKAAKPRDRAYPSRLSRLRTMPIRGW